MFSTRLFCDLHGNELLYHKPRGEVKGDTAGYDATPAGKIDMFKVKLTLLQYPPVENHGKTFFLTKALLKLVNASPDKCDLELSGKAR